MDKFKSIIDTYLDNYLLYDNGKVLFQCKYGELIFNKNTNDMITLNVIYIEPKYRRRGFCRGILEYLMEKGEKHRFKYLCVESVLSNILYDYLVRFNYKNKNFKVVRDGFVAKL